jgi:hypothetical protein
MAQNPGVFEAPSTAVVKPKEPFAAGSGYDKRAFYPPSYVLPGTRENKTAITSFNDSDSKEAKAIGSDIDAAFAEKSIFDVNYKKWREEADRISATPSMDASIPGVPASADKIMPKEPVRSSYGSWLTSKGANKDEVITNLLKEGEQSTFLFNRLMQEGLMDIIKEDPNALRDQEFFTKILLEKKLLSPEERAHYLGGNNKYSKIYRTDIHSRVWDAAKEAGLVEEQHPTTYLERLQSGVPLNPESKSDLEMFKAAKRMQRNPGFSDWVNNAKSALGHLYGSVMDFAPSVLEAFVHPDYTWSDDFKNASGENAELKQQFIFELNRLLEQRRLSKDTLGGFPGELKGFKEKHGGLSEHDSLRMFLDSKDPTSVRQIDEQSEKVVKLYAKLRKKGAFSGAENLALAAGQNTAGSVLSVLDGIVTATAGLSYLVTSTDPNSAITEYFGSQFFDLADESRYALGAITWEDVQLKAQMRYINAVQAMREGIASIPEEGLFTKISGAGSQRVRENASMFLDVWTARALYKNFGKLIGFGGVETVKGAAEGAAREAAIEGRLIAKEIERKGGKLEGPSRLLLDSVKDTAKANGMVIDDYEAIERIISGRARWLNPATKTLEPIPKQMIEALKTDIVNKSNSIGGVRRQFAKIVKEGRNINYSTASEETIKRVRQRLSEIEPGLWDDASNFEIYQRLMQGGIAMPAGKTSAVNITESMINNMRKEVGDAWRKFDASDLAGYKDLEAIEDLLMNMPGRGVTYGLSRALKGVQAGLDKTSKEVSRFNMPSQGEVAAILGATGDVDKAASMNMTVTSTGNWAAKWNEGRKIWSIANLAGYGGYFFEFWNDWLKSSSLATSEARSVSGILRKSYGTQLDDALAELERTAAGVKTGLNTKEEHAKLMAKIERLTALKQFSSIVNGLVEHGIGAGVYQMGNVMASSFVNEGMMWLGDTQMLGTATGYTFGTKSLSIMNRAFIRNVSPTHGMNERTVLDLMELSARMAEMDHDQAATIRQMIDTLVERRDSKINAPGAMLMKVNQSILAQKEFAAYVSLINRALSGTNVEFHDASVVSSAVALWGSREFATPEIAEAAKDQFLKQAKELGLTGLEAEAHAKQMMKTHADSLAAEAGIGDIDIKIGKLKELVGNLEKDGKDRISKFRDVAKLVAQEAGVSVENVQLNEQGFVVTAAGKDGTPIDITSNLSAKTISKINSFKSTWIELSKELAENKQQVLDANSQISALEGERSKLVPSLSPTRSARIGEFLTLDNGVTIEKREGVILFHVPTDDGFGNMVSKTQILIDKDAFLRPATSTTRPGASIVLEELAHALFLSDALASNRTTFMRHFLGKWELNEHNEFVMKEGPTVAKTPEQAIAFMDMYAKAYADGLGPEQGPIFLARWEHGKKQWQTNKADTRHMQDVFLEIWGKVYQMRQLVANPQAVKTGATPQSFHGRWETSPIVAGNGVWKNFFKFAFGQTTFMDIITQDDANNLLAYYSREIDESKMTHEEIEIRKQQIAQLEERIAGSKMWTDMFMMGGVYDKLMRSTVIDIGRKFGFKMQGNDSPDPAKFFASTELWDEVTGKYAPIHPSLQQTVDAAHAMTRGVPSQISMNDNFMFDSIHNEENSIAPEAKQRRILWAFATGRKEWLGKDGKFKAPIAQLFKEESKPIEIFKNVVVDTDDRGQIYGLLPFKNKKGQIVLSGTPNKEQSQRLIEWLKTTGQYGATSPFRMNEHHLDTIAKMLDAIGRSDILDAENLKNKTAGYVPVFLVDYAGVTHMTETGKVVRGHQGMRRFAPYAVVIDQTTLDEAGYKMKEKDKRGYLTEKNMEPVDMIYFWVIDVDAWNDRSKASWEGTLKDAKDARYEWTHQEVKNMFTNYNMFIEAQEKVLMNFSQGGPYQGNATRFPPKRTWQVLLPYANGNQKVAMKMADIILRTIGFPDTELGELIALESKDAKKLSADEKARLKTLRDKDIERDEAGEFFARLRAKNQNEYGSGAGFDAKMIFTKIRPDRVLGSIGRVLTKSGEPAMIPFTNNVYSWGRANHATGSSWFNITNNEITTMSNQYNMGDDRVMSGARHASGYSLWLVERKNPAFHVTEQRWIAFDPERRRVSGEFKLRADAENAAMKHSTENPLSNSPQIGNAFEMSMSESGFIPVGTTFEAGRRTEFISKDGTWTVKRNPATKKFDLIDTKSGLTIRTNMSLKGNQQGARTDVLMATIQDAMESNSVEIAVTNEKHRQLTESGIMEWKKTTVENGVQQQVRFADKNPVYWAFKKHLRNVGDAAWANEVVASMVQELGADVVERSPSKTIEWIQDFRKKGHFGWYFDNKVLAQAQKTFRETVASEKDAADRKKVPINPVRPKTPTGPKPAHYTNEEWLAMRAEIDAAQVDYDIWHEGAVEREQDVARHRESLELALKWSDSLIKDYETFIERERKGPAPTTTNNMEAAHFAELHLQTINAVRKAGVATRNITYLNDFGYLIAQIAPKDVLDLGGKKVVMPSISGAIANTLTGKNTKYRPNLFYVYSPKGMLVGSYKTFAEASEASNEDILKRRNLEAVRPGLSQGERTEIEKRYNR